MSWRKEEIKQKINKIKTQTSSGNLRFQNSKMEG